MPSRTIRSLALALCLGVVAVHETAAQQKNVAFTNVPDFLRLSWNIMLGADSRGDIVSRKGHIVTGNAIFMFSTNPTPKVAGDYSEMLDVDAVVQYNLPSETASSGYLTLFHLRAKSADVIIRPGHSWWTISVRHGTSGPYVSYVVLLAGHEAGLREAGTFDRELETQRRILRDNYASYSRGLD